ncbi:MAG TPA: hypothetical protein VNW54_10705 [Granulicella sp.]|jgi:hypothetical protein|nr:hypothetical protein [Granulicella sp.]
MQDPARAPRRRVLRVLALLGVSLALIVLVGLVILWARYRSLRENGDTILHDRLVAALSTRFHSPVELDSLHLDTANGLHLTGKGLRILYLAGPTRPDANPVAAPPMLTVASFEFQTDLMRLLKPTLRVVTVYVQGMQLHIPPHRRLPLGAMPDSPRRRGQPRLGISVDRIVVADSELVLETSTPGKLPLVFHIANLTLTDVGQRKPFEYDASLTNPRPVGNIRSTGHFGPWQQDNPRDTPIDGSYWFLHADLGSIKGLGGTLSSSGRFSGTLGDVAVAGSTDTPDFRLDISNHPVALHTDFQAEVNGMTGDTTLKQVDVRVLHSILHASGSVTRVGTPATGVTGHDTELTVDMGPHDHGRIEDMLLLGVKTAPPVLRGAMITHQRLSVPPGKESVSRKMRLEGSFTISAATFSNPNFQHTIDRLSMRAQGHPQQANARDAAPVTSTLSGRFLQADAIVDVSNLEMTMPGATGELTGRYSLDGQRFDFRGLIRTQATASQMTTGWVSKLLRPLDPLLERNGAGLEIPITISGTKSSPSFGIDTKRLFQ